MRDAVASALWIKIRSTAGIASGAIGMGVASAGASLLEGGGVVKVLLEGGAIAVLALIFLVYMRSVQQTQRESLEVVRGAIDAQRDEGEKDRAAAARTFTVLLDRHDRQTAEMHARFDAANTRHSEDIRAIADPLSKLAKANESLIQEVRDDRVYLREIMERLPRLVAANTETRE